MAIYRKYSSYIFLFLMFAVLPVLAGCNTMYTRLADAKVDAAEKAAAEKLAAGLLTSMREGQYKPLGDEATNAMRSALTPEKQKDSYEDIRGMFGDFQSLEYAGTWIPKDGTLLKIYRFRGRFSATTARPEIRVVMDGNGKLAGFWIKPWIPAIT
ncbi:MAG: hypothetical protein JXJ19_05460 [Elusimicrobia bacterium]|nr:hypothetical protein [Elusimicrobiota bacterium]